MKINLDTVADDAQIQIVPMIDVIFCILTFFILAALQVTRQQGINLNVGTPQAKTGVSQMQQTLIVSIDPFGQTFIDGNPIDRSQLYTLLKQYHEKNPNGLLVLNASKEAVYDQVIQVLDVLRAVGGDKVALATIPSPTIAPAPNPSNGQFGMPGAAPNLFPQNGLPGMPLVPGQTDPLLPPSNNPLAPPGPTQPNAVFQPSGGTSAPATGAPSGTSSGTPNGTSTSPTTGAPTTTPDGLPTGEPPLPADASPDMPDLSQPVVPPTTQQR
jgi:biopolymer transport protein ExbD